ncbi:unnamed protein product [Paramecium sonneborni]|uniref:Uncharacterized protein n=1 Tax=Paramecium sonneborni TaxID=65129 RepID=A0A8S1RL55_9CILI|nr:unnamed protein product [Paramecium sonneborni]
MQILLVLLLTVKVGNFEMGVIFKSQIVEDLLSQVVIKDLMIKLLFLKHLSCLRIIKLLSDLHFGGCYKNLIFQQD